MTSAFVEPLDVLSLRGNRLFGDAGSWGEAQMPPPPSVLAGALRSQILAQGGVDFTAFADGRVPHPVLGTPTQPGPFVLAACTLARRRDVSVQTLHALPADLVDAGAKLRAMQPRAPHALLAGSAPLPLWPVLAEDERAKAESARWLAAEGLRRWMTGSVPGGDALVASEELWKFEPRVGVALDPASRRADDGKLFSLQAIALVQGVGFALRVRGAELRPGMLRLGGDGRGARLRPERIEWPEPDYEALARAGRARLLLTSPGLFPRGWLPVGSGAPDARSGASFELRGVRARIVCAAVPRAQLVSGFDLARRQPKPARRAAPAGAVYWLDELRATPDALRKLVAEGLWPESADDPGMDLARRAEGFNRCTFGAWPDAA